MFIFLKIYFPIYDILLRKNILSLPFMCKQMNENLPKSFLSKLPRYTFSFLWGICIFVLCVVNFSESPINEINLWEGIDKVVHGIMYFILTGIVIWEFRHREKVFFKTTKIKQLFWIALLLPVFYGGLIEYIQGFLSYRGEESIDLVADVLGSLFAFLAYDIVVLYKTKK